MSNRQIAIDTVLEDYYDADDTQKVAALDAHYELLDEKTKMGGRKWRVVANPPKPEPTPQEIIDTYDNALEDYIAQTIRARGYTKREPSDYGKDQSDVVRYKQDAIDYKHFRDAVMLAGLSKLNEYKETGTIPCGIVPALALFRN